MIIRRAAFWFTQGTIFIIFLTPFALRAEDYGHFQFRTAQDAAIFAANDATNSYIKSENDNKACLPLKEGMILAAQENKKIKVNFIVSAIESDDQFFSRRFCDFSNSSGFVHVLIDVSKDLTPDEKALINKIQLFRGKIKFFRPTAAQIDFQVFRGAGVCLYEKSPRSGYDSERMYFVTTEKVILKSGTKSVTAPAIMVRSNWGEPNVPSGTLLHMVDMVSGLSSAEIVGSFVKNPYLDDRVQLILDYNANILQILYRESSVKYDASADR